MQVHSPEKQHKVMIEAVENHMPEVIVVDEIGTSEEASAARTIAERGVQLVATAHGYQLENLINNPTLSDLIGGIQTVVLGDEEAKFRGSNKTVLERKNAPTFDAVIELKSRNKFVIHNPVAAHVDGILKDDPIEPETRTRQNEFRSKPQQETPKPIQATKQDTLHIYPLGIRASLIKSVALTLQIPIQIVTASSDADMILSTKSQSRSKTTLSSLLKTTDIPVHIIKKNTHDSLSLFFKKWFHLSDASHILEAEATREIQLACQQAISESRIIELSPQPSHIRRLQHQHTNEIGLNSMSVGEDPNRRVRVYPRSEN